MATSMQTALDRAWEALEKVSAIQTDRAKDLSERKAWPKPGEAAFEEWEEIAFLLWSDVCQMATLARTATWHLEESRE